MHKYCINWFPCLYTKPKYQSGSKCIGKAGIKLTQSYQFYKMCSYDFNKILIKCLSAKIKHFRLLKNAAEYMAKK